MSKSIDDRLSETVTYVSNCNLLPDAGMQRRAGEFVDKFVRDLAGQAKTVSDSLAIGDSSADPQNFRPKRRAYVLLHKAISAYAVDCLPAGIPPANISLAGPAAAAQLPGLLKIAAYMRDRQTMSSYCMNMVLTELKQTPLQFLQANKLIVNGTTKWDRTQGDRNVLSFYLSYEGGRARYRIETLATPGAVGLQADSVVARWWTDIPGSYVRGGNTLLGNFSQLTGIELASELMVTTQFTGCAFAMKRLNGRVYCSHTTPRPPMTGFTDTVRPMSGFILAHEIQTLNGVAGDFANAAGGPPLTIYGAGYSVGTINGVSYPQGLNQGNYMTIIGVPQGGGDYGIYSQVTQNNAITSAVKIF